MSIKPYLLFSILIFPITCFGLIGLTDWSNVTPEGNIISNFSSNSIELKNNYQIRNLKRWYFYKGNILGELKEPDTAGFRYFSVTEFNQQVHMFRTESDFKTFINENNLEPLVWIRWYSGNWVKISFRNLLVLLFLGFIVVFPLIVMIVRASMKRTNRQKKLYSRALIVVIGLFVVRIILEQFPSSI